MKHFKVFVSGLALACFVMVSYGHAQEQQEKKAAQVVVEQPKAPAVTEAAAPAVTGTASLGVFNKYIFRGYELSKNSVVIQPGLTASVGGFSASYWGNIDSKEHETQNFVPDRPGHKSFNETDLTLSYTKSFGKLSLTGGYIYYDTKYANETQEIFGTVTYDIIGKPTLSIFRDVDAYPGTYFNFSLAHSIKLPKEITLDLGASVGYMSGDGKYWKTLTSSTKYSAFHDGMVKAGLTIPLTQKVSLAPVVQYWFPLSDKASKKNYNPNGRLESNVVGGATITYTF